MLCLVLHVIYGDVQQTFWIFGSLFVLPQEATDRRLQDKLAILFQCQILKTFILYTRHKLKFLTYHIRFSHG